MIPKPLKAFINNLKLATENNELKWYEGEEDSYICDHNDVTLHVSSRFDFDREVSLYRFRIIDKTNRVTPFTVEEHEEEDYYLMRSLFESIIANSNDVASIIKNFF